MSFKKMIIEALGGEVKRIKCHICGEPVPKDTGICLKENGGDAFYTGVHPLCLFDAVHKIKYLVKNQKELIKKNNEIFNMLNLLFKEVETEELREFWKKKGYLKEVKKKRKKKK